MTEAEQYAVIYPDRAAAIRRHGGMPPGAKYPPPDDAVFTEIVTGNSLVFRDLDAQRAADARLGIRDRVSGNDAMRQRWDIWPDGVASPSRAWMAGSNHRVKPRGDGHPAMTGEAWFAVSPCQNENCCAQADCAWTERSDRCIDHRAGQGAASGPNVARIRRKLCSTS